MSNQRRHKRCRTSDYYTVTDRSNNQIIGRTANISMGGMMLITDSQLEVDQFYSFRLNLPESVEYGVGFPFDGCCRWSQHNDLAGWWENGIQITEISDEARETIRKLTEEDPVEKSDHPS